MARKNWMKKIDKKRRAMTRRQLGCESLEDRRVLTTFNFPADGTIDAIVASANADVAGAPHIIEITADATATGELILNNSTTINGNGNTLTGSGSARVLHFNDNDPAVATDNAINDLTITGGDATGAAGPYGSYAGGGVRNAETLTITGSVVTANRSRLGGGVSNLGTITLDNVTVSNNEAAESTANTNIYSSSGGGLFNSGVATISGSMIMDNTASHDDFANYGSFGGGLTNVGTLTATASTISGNEAELGGGVNLGADSVTNFTDVNVDGNGAPGVGTGSAPRGGGIYASGYYDNAGGPFQYAELTMTGGSISNNSVAGDATNIGGGLSAGPEALIELNGTVISGNSALESGGGIYASAFSSAAGGYVSQSQLTLNDVSISANTIPYSYNATGGAVFPYGGGFLAGRGTVITMSGGDISDNVIGDGIANAGNGRGAGILTDIFSYGNPGATNDVVLDGVTISGNFSNDANAFGGGVGGSQGGNLVIRNSTITGNTAGGGGSGVGGGVGLLFDASVTLEDTYVGGNTSGGDAGGVQTSVGAAAYFAGATLNVTRSTIANNTSGFDGGAISSYASTTTLTNATLSGNNSANEGGAIWHLNGAAGALAIDFSTVTGNTGNTVGAAGYGGAALYLLDPTTLSNSIVSGNNGGDVADINGYSTVSYSLVNDITQAPYLADGVDGNIVGTPAVLGTLAAAGGNGVPVHALAAGDPGTGVANTAATEALDGRGLARPGADGLRDLGAFESDADMPGEPCDFDGDGDCDGDDIDALQAAAVAGGTDLDFDLDGDGDVDIDDRAEWLLQAGILNLGGTTGYLIGDINLDGSVDVSDFNVWNGNRFSSNSNWTLGDITMDGSIDVSDFNAWNGNRFMSSSIVAPTVTPFAAGETAHSALSGNAGTSAAVQSGTAREIAASKGITDLDFKKDGFAMEAQRGNFRAEVNGVNTSSATQTVFVGIESGELSAANEVALTSVEGSSVQNVTVNSGHEVDSVADDRLRTSQAEKIDAVFAGLGGL